MLASMAQICAASHTPFIAAAAPTLMNMDTWQELMDPRDLTKIFQTPEYAAWRSLRDSEDSRYLGLTMPRRCLACLTARRPIRSTNSTSKKTPKERITPNTVGPTRPTRWLRTSTALSSSTAGAREFAAAKAAAWSRNCRCIHFRPTTAAWT